MLALPGADLHLQEALHSSSLAFLSPSALSDLVGVVANGDVAAVMMCIGRPVAGKSNMAHKVDIVSVQIVLVKYNKNMGSIGWDMTVWPLVMLGRLVSR